MSRFWLVAAVVSIAAHVAAASFISQHEATKPRIARPPIEMEIAEVKKPPPPPEVKELPPPPPPKKPIVVKKIVPKIVPPAVEPPPPAAPKIGIDPENSANGSSVSVASGVSLDGEVGTGNVMDKTIPPPEAPVPPQPPAKGKRFIPSYQVTRQPIAKHPVQPEIPEAFRDAQREALVVVELEIDETGHVHSARVLRHADFGLDDAALAAAKATEFEPALMGTTPVAVRYQIPYRFKVRG